MKTVSKVRDFLIVINVKPSGFPVNIRCNSRPLLKMMLRCLKCYNVSLAYSLNKVSDRNFNRKFINKRSIVKVIKIIN